MSGIRRFTRRRQALKNLKKNKARFTILDVISLLGISITVLSIFLGIMSYFYYTGGRPEGIRQTRGGNFYVEHEEAGRLYYRDRVKYCAVFTVTGLTVSILSAIIKDVIEKKD